LKLLLNLSFTLRNTAISCMSCGRSIQTWLLVLKT